MPQPKHEIVTFKADAALLEALGGIPNRSEFIRNAILAALENLCPLCRGTGTLTPAQKNHWNRFAATHGVERCDECDAFYLTCHQTAAVGETGDGPHEAESSRSA